MRTQIQTSHLRITDLHARRILSRIQNRFHLQASAGGSCADQIYHRLITYQRLPPPVHTDKRKKPVFDLVPFARPRRVMTHRDLHAQLPAQLLQMIFPGSIAGSIAPPSVRTDQPTSGTRITTTPHQSPPPPNALHRPVALQRIIHLLQQPLHCVLAESVAKALQLIPYFIGRLVGPLQQRHRIPRRCFVHDSHQRLDRLRISLLDFLASTPNLPNTFPYAQSCPRLQLLDPFDHRRLRQATHSTHPANPAASPSQGFASNKPTLLRFIQRVEHSLHQRLIVLYWHKPTLSYQRHMVNVIFTATA